MSQSFQPAGPAWWQYVWTFLFSMAVAAGFCAVGILASGSGAWRSPAGLAQWYLNYLVVSLAIGYAIHGLFNLGRRLLGRARIQNLSHWQRALYFGGLPIVGMVIGLAIGLPLVDRSASTVHVSRDADGWVGSLLFGLLIWALFYLYFQARFRRLAAERRAAEAQLRLLQGQMEPHFLFNTLANVVSLMELDAPRAKAMLESFTDYLRASLVSLRAPEHSLGDELELVEAYLRVVKVRMEDRLHYRIDVPPALRTRRVPALSLQPLVENAVLHGLEPSVDGGSIELSAAVEGGGRGRLALRVADDGIGLHTPVGKAQRGSGNALKNLRERLQQSHGDEAQLRVEPALPRGVVATLSLPTENAP